MAYALRYYKELIHEDGSVHRLEIHKKDSTAEAVEIGAVIQGLALEIQGSQGDVDSPIVKTSLSMTFVDAGDIEDGRKNGFWQEFYTPDALLWKVILKARTATETSFRTMWGGYVTPDSFSENLVYRGSVNIIARDNIGHMQDFPFDAVGDADGLISLRNLVEAGWEKIQSPMVLDWRGETESNMWLMCDGVPAPDTLMNVSQFEGMDWYKAIETALASYGIVMRWVGDNIVNVSSLRSMPLQGREVMDNLSQITPVFVAGAQRELVPAVRRIEESVSYDLQETLSMPKLDSSAFTGNTQSYRCKIDGVDIGYGQFGTLEHDAPIWPINPNNGWSDEDDATTLFFNPKAYELGTFASRRGLGDEIYRYMYIAANNVDDRRVSFTRSITCADVTISMKLGQPCNLDILSRIEQQSVFNLKRITFAVILEQDGVTRYYNGRSWGASYAEISVDYDPTSPSYEFSQFVSMDDNAGAAELTFCIVKIEYAQTSYVGNSSVYGLYACIQDLSFNIPESSSLLSDNSVNTVYNSENNVILSRTPEIGPAYNVVALPGLIKNGIFYRSEGVILPARAWGWSGSTPQQMAVYNHLQLLCYYAKPNNLISGTIVNGDLTSGRAIYLWHGKEHLLVSGRYNLLNGMIEGAMLREFTRYGAMWGEVSETAFPDTEQDSTTNVEGGASSGGSSPTYTNTTTVNIGSGGGGGASYLNDLMDVNTDSVTNQSVLYYNGTEWVGRSLSAILNSYAKSADLLTLSNLLASMWSIDADGNLVTDKQVIIKNNLIVKGDTSSGGSGSGETVIGTTSIVVDGVSYPSKDGVIDLSKAFEGLQVEIDLSNYATKGYVTTAISNLNIDQYATDDELSQVSGRVETIENAGYATTKEVESAITNLNISQYLKSTTAESTYAKIASLTAVDDRLKGIEAYFSTSEDADTQINKWNEIVAFLNATEGTTLAGILAAYTLQSDFDTLSSDVGNISNTVKGHTSSIGSNASAIGVLQGYFTNGVAKKATADASGNVITSYYTPISTHNAFKESTNASLASKADKATTLAGYGIEDAYTTTQIDAKVQTINSSITALDTKYAPVKTWYDALGSLIVKDGNNVRIKTNLIVEGDTASGGTGGGAAIGVTGILVDGKQYTDNDSDGYIDLSEAFAGLSPTITSTMITEALGYVPANSASLGSLASKDSLVASDIPDLSGKYLSTAGGTMTGAITMSGAVSRLKMNGGLIEFNDASGNFVAYLRGANNTLQMYDNTSWRTIYHSGNFNPADYLPLSGGKISGSLQIGNDDNTSAVLLKTVRLGHYAAFRNTVNEMILSFGETSASTPEKMLAMGDSGLRYSADGGSAYNTLLHSGNVGEYAFTTAAKTLTSSDTLDAHLTGLYGYKNANNPTNSFGQNAAVLSLKGIKSAPVFQLAFDGNTTSVGFRNQNYAGTWSTWKTIAFTDSNVESAKYMATLFSNGSAWYTNKYRLYGQYNSVDGQTLELKTEGGYKVRTDIATKLATARTIWGQSFDGTGDITGSLTLGYGAFLYRKDSSGTIRSVLDFSTNTLELGYGLAAAGYNTHYHGKNILFYINGDYTEIMRLTYGGNVGIGTTDPQYKLDVAGQGRFTGAVTFNGSVYLKGGVEVYGTIPYIDFHFGNATDDYTSRISEIASGNLAVYANWLPNTNNAKRLGNSDRRWSEIFGVNGNLSGTLEVGGASTFNGDVRINGNLVVTGDTASGGTGESTTEDSGVLTWKQKPPTGTGLTVTDLRNVGITSPMLLSLVKGAYHHVIIKESSTTHKLYSVSGRSVSATNYQITLISGLPDDSNYSVYTIRRAPTGWNITKI